ncbi:hypothetical protein [Lentzea kentuckyensis]|uniref:hypothetical protein n=1 Tax=Lentzea kentuckyensis TaxID=360086 RepID=UPI00146FA24C|nr:hypothetical protein [Lentzea kentuckyensis]
MSHQLDNAVSNVDQAMKQLRTAMDRREGFTDLRRRFVRSVSVLTTEASYARGQLPKD